MTTASLAKILDAYLTDIDGQAGFWRGERDDVSVFVYSDDAHDRLRLMAPVGVLEELDVDLLHLLLQANYDRALDARYAMRGNELWAVVVHPLATLATDDLPSLLNQVVALVKNTGTTFASTELVFRSAPLLTTEGGEDGGADEEAGSDDDDDESEEGGSRQGGAS